MLTAFNNVRAGTFDYLDLSKTTTAEHDVPLMTGPRAMQHNILTLEAIVLSAQTDRHTHVHTHTHSRQPETQNISMCTYKKKKFPYRQTYDHTVTSFKVPSYQN